MKWFSFYVIFGVKVWDSCRISYWLPSAIFNNFKFWTMSFVYYHLIWRETIIVSLYNIKVYLAINKFKVIHQSAQAFIYYRGRLADVILLKPWQYDWPGSSCCWEHRGAPFNFHTHTHLTSVTLVTAPIRLLLGTDLWLSRTLTRLLLKRKTMIFYY